MQPIRTVTLVVLCVLALCCADAVLAANSVVDSNGRIWCVRTEASPAPMVGQEVYLYDDEGTFGEFITMDKTPDSTPHVFLTPTGRIGIVWSRENGTTGRMEIYSTIYDQESDLWAHPSPLLTRPPGDVDHTEPRLEMSLSGAAHLVYVALSMEDGRTVSTLIYRVKQNGAWSEPNPISQSDESANAPELYMGASEEGYPLVLVYMSSPRQDGCIHSGPSNLSQTIKALEKSGVDPSPWGKLSKHLLPINVR